MKRLRVLILLFAMALAVPLGYLVVKTHRSLEQEETSELRYFANTLFDQMEQELAALVHFVGSLAREPKCQLTNHQRANLVLDRGFLAPGHPR